MTSEMTVVVFRKWRKGQGEGIIALFPFEAAEQGHCMSYEHIGQHGGADYEGVIKNTNPANTDEYCELKSELEKIGYKLVIKEHISWRKHSLIG